MKQNPQKKTKSKQTELTPKPKAVLEPKKEKTIIAKGIYVK